MGKIVIADICSTSDANKSTGHYFSVAQNFVDMFSQSYDVRVAGGPIYNQKFSSCLIALPYNHNAGESKWSEKFHELANCRTLSKRVGDDDILIMQSIALVTAFVGVLLFFHKPCKLFFIQYNTECISSPLKRLLWKMVSPKVCGIIGTFPTVAQAYGKPYIIIPDYVYAQRNSVSFSTYDEREYDVCFVGNIYKDKGVIEALQYLKGKGLKIIVAGKIGEPDIEHKLKSIASADSGIVLRIGFLTTDEYNEVLANSKYCILNYRGRYNEHSSGVVYDALFHGTPVLASATASTQMVKDYALGISFTNLSEIDMTKLSDANFYAKCQERIVKYLTQQREIIGQLSHFIHQA